MNRLYTVLAGGTALFLVFLVFRGFADLVLWIGLILFGALLTVVVMTIKGHPTVALPDFPSEFVAPERAPDAEDVTQAEAEDAEAAA